MDNKFSEDGNLMADMVEVRMKLYSCRICGIRYDNMMAIKQHYRDEHTTIEDVKTPTIKEEIDDEISERSFVLVDEGQLIPEGIELGENQVLQIANTTENGQIVFQVIQSDDPHAQELVAQAQQQLEQQPTPSKKSRKRKNTEKDSTPISSGRPKRVVVPNIKSEFVYEGISTTTPIESVSDQQSGTTYTLVQDGDVITAWQTGNGEADIEPKDKIGDQSDDAAFDSTGETSNHAVEVNNDDPEYPPDYTPTSKIKKGRINEPKTDDSPLRRFPCPFQGCKYVAKYRSNLWDHKKTHTGEKPYVCTWPSCTMRFSQTHQLKLHLRSHTGERPYVCDWPGCNSAFSQKPGLKSHMLTHTGEKPFKCDYPGCDWSFRLKGALTDHKRAIHENAKKFVCEWPGCNKRFLQHCHLKKHIMGHADIKPFSCDWPNCNYKAVTMAYVTNHRKTHTGEKNYECTYPNCNKRFVKSSHVNRHRQRCHPDLFMMVSDDGMHEEGHHDSMQDSDDTSIISSGGSSRERMKRESQIVYKIANPNDHQVDDDGEVGEDGAATIYIQPEEVEEEMVSDSVQFINGSVVSDGGEHYILSTAEDGTAEATPIMIELKKEKTDEETQVLQLVQQEEVEEEEEEVGETTNVKAETVVRNDEDNSVGSQANTTTEEATAEGGEKQQDETTGDGDGTSQTTYILNNIHY